MTTRETRIDASSYEKKLSVPSGVAVPPSRFSRSRQSIPEVIQGSEAKVKMEGAASPEI
jgi:hypothetical protein